MFFRETQRLLCFWKSTQSAQLGQHSLDQATVAALVCIPPGVPSRSTSSD